MNASQLIYCNSSSKRVLLVSENQSIEKDLEGILQQIQMKESLKRISWAGFSLDMLEKYEPHLLVLDGIQCLPKKSLATLKNSKPALPIIILYESMSEDMQEELIQLGIRKNIKQDTLRFCGQILYRSIHGYAIHEYYQKQMKTRKQVEKNIKGLEDIQAFWGHSKQIQDDSCKEVLSEIDAALDYLSQLHKELGKNLRPNN